MSTVPATAKKIIGNVEQVVIGKRQELILALVAYFCEGHILLEDVPGVAKTMLARALALSVSCTFKRVQCTPDLLPTDITGASIFNQKTTEFSFRPGPLFAQIVLADEINRATPRTQAALLEAMGEGRVTVNGATYVLERPFLVIATQNPIDHEGTFPLPEAQLDRFLIRLSLGYPSLEDEGRMLERLQHAHPIEQLGPVVTADEVLACQQAIRSIHVDEKIRNYLLEIIRQTRLHDDVQLGGSPRASLALFRTAQALAAIRGNAFVLPDDIKRLAPVVLGHRLILRPESRLRKVTAAHVIDEILDEVAAPLPGAACGWHMKSLANTAGVPPAAGSASRRGGNSLRRWFVGVLLFLVAAILLQLSLLVFSMYVLLAVLVSSRYLAGTWVAGLTATRECNRVAVEIGETVAVVVTAVNQGSLPVPWALLEDLLPRAALVQRPPRLKVQGKRLLLAMFGKGARRMLNYQLTFQMRGYYQIGPLVIETGDLFGLHRRYVVSSAPHFVLVYPKVLPLTGYELASRRPIGEIRLAHRLYEDPTRIAGVRQYLPGDPFQRVHWRATARTGILHSKIYEPSTVAGATVLLDLHRTSWPTRNEPIRSELAITAAASLANAVYQMGQQIGLATNGRDAVDRIREEGWQGGFDTRLAAQTQAGMQAESDRLQPVAVPTRRGPEQLRRILETLARVELTDGLTFPQLVFESTSRLPRDATVVAILADAPAETAWALSTLKRRGFAVTAVLIVYEEYDYLEAAGRLIAAGIPVRRVHDEASLLDLCRRNLVMAI